ncbi:hypothetical protein A9G11_04080 [Gilliamella sp. wkB108]|uniref:hypothetical protein n=1 Tax=Gilliamella sp. wkB108 TaxID=3120256 RepID=UPI0008286EFE|nr:hypothetical protein [Gilliamella apicola]OCG24261.1 hypothetical protein A9G11_04080 [Gilliamella apicola]
MIASEADDKTRNRLETGTIGFSDIKNKAEYNVSSISVSGGASYGNQGDSGGSNKLTPTSNKPSVY